MAKTASATKVGPQFQVTIPKPIREAVGLRAGDFVQASVGTDGRTVVLRPKVLLDKESEDDLIIKQLEASEAAVVAGRTLGPFTSAGAAMKAVKAYARRGHRTVRR